MKQVFHPAKSTANGIIFDMDGVIFDTERDSISIIQTVGDSFGFSIPTPFIIENMGRNVAEESVIYHNYLGSDFDADLFWKRYWEIRSRKYQLEGMPVKEGALRLLKIAEQKNVPCAVASSSPAGQVLASLKRAGIHSFFSCIIGGDMVKNGKPAPDIFLAAASSLNLAPENCIVIEDSYNGLKAAKAAGTTVVFVKDIPDYSFDQLNAVANYSFDSADEAAELFN